MVFQLVSGDLLDLSQATVSRTTRRVSEALARHLGTFIRFPQNPQEQRRLMRQFYEVANFPEITSCVDGTHIPITNPGGEQAETFRNRKGIFSINVQVRPIVHENSTTL